MRREPLAALGLLLSGPILLALGAAGPRAALAEPLFAAPFLSYETGGRYATSVAIADVDEDGRPDLLVANQGEMGTGFQPITVLLANGDGTFRRFFQASAGWGPTEVVCHDLDGDGHLDLVVADGGGAAVAVLRGLGDGRFGPRSAYPAGSGSVSVAVGDVAGDAHVDLVVANWDSNTLSILRGQDGASFEAASDVAVPGRPQAVRLADLNGDGRADAAVACAEMDAVSVLIGAGDGVFAAPVVLPAGQAPVSVAIADLNGDGHLDLASADLQSSSVTVFIGNGDGSFLPGRAFPAGDSFALDRPMELAAGDVNGDAHADLVVAAQRNVWVLLGSGDGSFGPGMALEVGYGPSSGWGPAAVAIGDLDGDGRPDLAAATWRWLATVVVLPGNGDGSFGRGRELATPGRTGAVAARDLDGDGRVDLAAANAGESGTVSVFLGDGAAGFGAGAELEAGVMPRSVLLEDLDGDAHPEVLVANDDFYYPDPYAEPLRPQTVSVWPGHGDGSFEPRREVALGHRAASVATGLLNADAVPDLIVPSQLPARLSVLLGQGDGTFTAAAGVDLAHPPGSVALGDLDGDGHLDCVVASPADGIVSVLLGRGDGTFAAAGGEPSPYVSGLALADLDGDARLDLVLFGYSTVTLRRGTGDGGFLPRYELRLWNGPLAGAAADVDGDGWVDVIVADPSANTVSVLRGDGTGAVGPKEDFGTGHLPYAVTLADLNGDARPEIVVANEDAVLVLVNAGTDTPTPVVIQGFAAAAEDGAVLLTWRLDAAAGLPLQGLHVQRGRAAAGPFATLTTPALAPGAVSYRDAGVEAGRDYWYRLVLVPVAGEVQVTGPIHVRAAAGSAARRLVAAEAPGGGPVTIRYQVAAAGTPVELAIYDPRGRCLWSTGRAVHPAGEHVQLWDRRDRAGAVAPRGVYFLRLRAGAAELGRKLVLLHR